MGANHTHEVVFLKEILDGLVTEFKAALSDFVIFPRSLLDLFVIDRVRPEQVTEEPLQWRLHKSVNLVYVLHVVFQLRRDSSMHTQVVVRGHNR